MSKFSVSKRSAFTFASKKGSTSYPIIKQFDESKEAVDALIKKSLLHENEHAVHVEWLERI